MISGAGRLMTYDIENRPISIEAGGTLTTFVYDGDGGRVKKTVGTETSTYIGKLYECTAIGCSKHIFAGGTRIALKDVNTGDVVYYHSDHLGSSSVMTDGTGTIVQELAYFPYGNIRDNIGAVDVNYKYTGQEHDESTGLYFYNARYYDPVLGRFTQADTIVPGPRNPQNFNRYSYVRNNPINMIDPSGHGTHCVASDTDFSPNQCENEDGIAPETSIGQNDDEDCPLCGFIPPPGIIIGDDGGDGGGGDGGGSRAFYDLVNQTRSRSQPSSQICSNCGIILPNGGFISRSGGAGDFMVIASVPDFTTGGYYFVSVDVISPMFGSGLGSFASGGTLNEGRCVFGSCPSGLGGELIPQHGGNGGLLLNLWSANSAHTVDIYSILGNDPRDRLYNQRDLNSRLYDNESVSPGTGNGFQDRMNYPSGNFPGYLIIVPGSSEPGTGQDWRYRVPNHNPENFFDFTQ